MPLEIRHNSASQRFEVNIDGILAVLEYTRGDHRITFNHTLVPKELGGQGVGGQLAKVGLDYAREHQLRVIAVCPFVAKFIEKNADYQSLLDPSSGRL